VEVKEETCLNQIWDTKDHQCNSNLMDNIHHRAIHNKCQCNLILLNWCNNQDSTNQLCLFHNSQLFNYHSSNKTHLLLWQASKNLMKRRTLLVMLSTMK
jgi:hypothetical protein